MDGTLVDTEPYWMRAETELVESFGGVWTQEDCLLLVGSGLWNGAMVLAERGVDLDRVQEQLGQFGVPWRPGALELLTELKSARVPMALVTMSVERMARQIADLVGFDAFDTIVAGDMVTNSKPHPEAYLAAAGILGVAPGHCVAVEDSVPGVAAAVASGAIVIGVPHMIDLPESHLYDLWPTLAGRTVAGLAELYGERRTANEQARILALAGAANSEDTAGA
jgi:HAD superfamily hydrolase (TIGR01509 family)